jgi:hypothetical protein
MIATVTVRAYYQPHCRECMSQVEATVASAIRDGSVTSISLVASKKCEHDALAAPQLAGSSRSSHKPNATPTPPPAPGTMALLPGVEAATNGFDTAIQ